MKLSMLILSMLNLIICLTMIGKFSPAEFTVVIPSYNNQTWYKQNLDSVINQTYPYFNIIYINDCSTDQTRDLVDTYMEQSPSKSKIKVTHNTKRVGSLKNIYDAVYSCQDHKIIVILDGDDMLYHTQVLATLARLYANGQTWLTYGQFINSSNGSLGGAASYPKEIIEQCIFRKVSWRATHLRTYYAKLFKLIKKEDLVDSSGQFFEAACDLATMFPMLEMASRGHFKFINQILYRYNDQNPLNHFNNPKRQTAIANFICSKQPYQPLSNLFNN